MREPAEAVPITYMLPPDQIRIIPYNRAGLPLRSAIAWLQHRADPSISPVPTDPPAPEHDPALDALSFYLVENERVISYAAIVHLTIQHAGYTWRAAGLSCVATDPAYQRRGLASRVVACATCGMLESNADLGIFTCDPGLVPFYQRAGAWQHAQTTVLLGSRHPGALTSRMLGKAVLLRLISPSAQAMAAAFEQCAIDLGLPTGQFL